MISNCTGDCDVEHRGTRTTLLGWTPRYDKHGNQLNQDPNTVTKSFYCRTCDTAWETK